MAAGRIFLDVTGALKHPLGRRAVIGFASLLDRQMAELLQTVADREPELSLAPAPRFPIRPPLSFVVELAGRILWGIFTPDATRRRAMAHAERLYTALDRKARSLRPWRSGAGSSWSSLVSSSPA